ncbi:ester cyclase [Solihabitans fulvus]|nr:ester cyclase [Solihabitans fulvus]
MTEDDLRDLAREIADQVWHRGRLAAIDDHFREDLVAHVPERPAVRGRRAYRELILATRTSFPDLRQEVDLVIAQSGTVVLRSRYLGTQRGEHDGIPPTGRRVEITELLWLRFDGDQVAELWQELNNLTVLDQLGVIPPRQATEFARFRHVLRTVGRLAALKARSVAAQRRGAK